MTQIELALAFFYLFTKDYPKLKCQPSLPPDGSFVRAEIKKNASPSQRGDEFSKITSSVAQRVNTSREAKRLDRPAQSSLNKFETAEVDKYAPPIQPWHLVSNITIQSSGTRIKPFSNEAEALDRQTLNCLAANIVGTEVENNTPPAHLRGVPSSNITDSSGNKVNPFSKRAKGVTRLPHTPTPNFVMAETVPVRNSHAVISNDAMFKNTVFDITTQYSGGQINPLSKKTEAQERLPHDCPAADIRGAKNKNNTPPIHLKGVPSNNITDSSGNKVNPFSKRAKGVTRPPHTLTPNFAEVETLRNSPTIISNGATFKNTGTPSEINPFSKRAKGIIS